MDPAADSQPVGLRVATDELRPVVERLAQLERHDLSEFRGYTPDDRGVYAFRKLPLFFTEPGHRAYLIYHGRTLAGFTLTHPRPDGANSVFAFFIVRALRRKGIGQQAAQGLLQLLPGRWAIAFQEENSGAARFWRQVATAVVGPAWQEERLPPASPAAAGLPADTWLLLDTTP
jgi:predicted acetyltransferase